MANTVSSVTVTQNTLKTAYNIDFSWTTNGKSTKRRVQRIRYNGKTGKVLDTKTVKSYANSVKNTDSASTSDYHSGAVDKGYSKAGTYFVYRVQLLQGGKVVAYKDSSAYWNKPSKPTVTKKQYDSDTNSITYKWSKPLASSISQTFSLTLQQYDMDDGKWTTAQTATNVTATNYTFSDLELATKYRLKITCAANSLTSEATYSKAITTTVNAPNMPTNVSAWLEDSNEEQTAHISGAGYFILQWQYNCDTAKQTKAAGTITAGGSAVAWSTTASAEDGDLVTQKFPLNITSSAATITIGSKTYSLTDTGTGYSVAYELTSVTNSAETTTANRAGTLAIPYPLSVTDTTSATQTTFPLMFSYIAPTYAYTHAAITAGGVQVYECDVLHEGGTYTVEVPYDNFAPDPDTATAYEIAITTPDGQSAAVSGTITASYSVPLAVGVQATVGDDYTVNLQPTIGAIVFQVTDISQKSATKYQFLGYSFGDYTVEGIENVDGSTLITRGIDEIYFENSLLTIEFRTEASFEEFRDSMCDDGFKVLVGYADTPDLLRVDYYRNGENIGSGGYFTYLTDYTPPLNEELTYTARVVYNSIPAPHGDESTVTVTGNVFAINYGDDLESVLVGEYNPDESEGYSRDIEAITYAGQTYPVIYDSGAIESNWSIGFTVLNEADYEQLQELAEGDSDIVLRDDKGNRIEATLKGVKMTRRFDGHFLQEVTLELVRHA